MTFRDGIRRDLQAKRQADRSQADEKKVLRIGDIVSLARTGQMSDSRSLEVIQQILNGDAERIVRVGEEYRPDMNTGEQR